MGGGPPMRHEKSATIARAMAPATSRRLGTDAAAVSRTWGLLARNINPPPPSLPRCWGPFPMTLASSPARWSHAGAVGAAHITDPLRGWREPARITGMLCETHRRRQPGWIGRDGASRRRHERIANTSALEERLPLALCPSPRHNPWLRHRPRPELLPRLTGVGSASTNGHRLSSAPLARGQREGER